MDDAKKIALKILSEDSKWKDHGHVEDKNGDRYAVKHHTDEHDRHHYEAYHHSNPTSPAAKVDMKRGNKKAMYIGTAPEHRRKGLMTALHHHIEKHLGHGMEKDWATTDDGEAFYKSRGQ